MKYIWRSDRYEAEDRDREECAGVIWKRSQTVWGARIWTRFSDDRYDTFGSKEAAMKWVEETLPKCVLKCYNYLVQEAEQFKKDYYPY